MSTSANPTLDTKKTTVVAVGNLGEPSLAGDVGFNLPAKDNVVIPAEGYRQVMTGIHLEMDEGTWCLIVPRSSANRSAKLIVLVGVIDNGYRGELGVMVHNVSHLASNEKAYDMLRFMTTASRMKLPRWFRGIVPRLKRRKTSVNDLVIKQGQSLGQAVFYESLVPMVRRAVSTDELSASDRGHNGYGHTGGGI